MLLIKYSDAPPGSGKTHNAVPKASRMAAEGKIVLFVQPTTDLIDMTIADEVGRLRPKPMHTPIHGKWSDSKKGVGKRLAEHLKDFGSEGQIIFVTHQVLEHVRYWPTNKRDVHLIIDEEFEVVRYKEHSLPKMHHIITDELTLEHHNAVYGRVVPRDRQKLEQMAKNGGEDEVLGTLNEALRVLCNPHWDTFVNLEQYSKLLKSDGVTKLELHSVLNPSFFEGFGSVFMASANFLDTVIYKLWSDKGVKFVEDTEFSAALRFNVHHNGHLMKIRYVTDEEWSKNLGKKVVDGVSVRDRLMTAAHVEFGDKAFLWQANKNFEANPFGEMACRLPHKPHGRNDYLHVSNILIASAILPKPSHCNFLKSVGFSKQDIYRSIYCAAAYQAVMRSSARSPDSTEPVTVIVPDKGLADYLAGLFPGATVTWLDAGLPQERLKKRGGRVKKYHSDAERGQAQRLVAKKRLLDEYNAMFGSSQYDLEGGYKNDKGDCHVDWSIESYKANCTGVFHGSLFGNNQQGLSDGYLKSADVASFVKALAHYH